MTTVTLEPLAMEEAKIFWKDKVQLSPGEFAKLSHESKIKAFGVSGIAKGDELTTVYNSLQRAIEEGIPFSRFKKDCAEIFERRGWTGKRDWRVQNIFRTNIQTSYNSGRWKKQKELAETFPFLQYSAVNDRRTRATHRAMNGRVYPIDHPVWDTWYPPNGYRCRCSTFSLTNAEVERKGLKVETEDPTDKPIELPDLITGEKVTVQQLLPDPGFSHHPGKVVWGGLVQQEKGNYLAMDNLRGPADYRRPNLAKVRPGSISNLDETKLLPSGRDDSFYKTEFERLYGDEIVATDAAGEPVVLSLRTYLQDKTPGAKEKWKFNKDGHGETIPLLKDAFENPYEIWLTPEKDDQTGRVRLSKQYVALWKTKDQKDIYGLMVLEVVDGIYQGVTAFISFNKGKPNLDHVEKKRRGVLLYPKR